MKECQVNTDNFCQYKYKIIIILSLYSPSFKKSTKMYSLGKTQRKQFLLKENHNNYKYDENEKKPIGLPNFGNTCFLNSILQFIFGTAIQDCIANIDQNVIDNEPHFIFREIIQIFSHLRKKQQMKFERPLKAIMKKLQLINFSYKKYSQQDCLQTLLNILNQAQDAMNKKFLPINIIYQQSCSCRQKLQLKIKFLPVNSPYCGKCHKKYVRTLMNYSKYIIFTNYQQQIVQPFKDVMTRFQKIPRKYRLIAQIVYNGNRSSGHYYCFRLEENVWYELNDLYVQKVEKSELQKYKGMILLYQMVSQDSLSTNIQLKQKLKKQEMVGEQQVQRRNKNIAIKSNSNLQKKEQNNSVKDQFGDQEIQKQKPQLQINNTIGKRQINFGLQDVKKKKQQQNSQKYQINKKLVQETKRQFTKPNYKLYFMHPNDKIQINKYYGFQIMAPSMISINKNGQLVIIKQSCDLQLKIIYNTKKKYQLVIKNTMNCGYYKHQQVTESKVIKEMFHEYFNMLKSKYKTIVPAKQLRELIQKYLQQKVKSIIDKKRQKMKAFNDLLLENFSYNKFEFDKTVRWLKKDR